MTALAKAYQTYYDVNPTNDGFYTWSNGYFIRFSGDGKNPTQVVIPLAELAPEQMAQIDQRMAQLAADKTFKTARRQGNQLEFIIAPKSFGKQKEYTASAEAIDQEISWLAGNQIETGCAACGLSGPHQVVSLNDYNLPLCPDCRRNHEQEVRQFYSRDEKGRNYLTGALGAILGAAVGSGIFFAVMHFTNRMFALLAVIIGFLASWLYRAFKGKLNTGGAVLAGLLTIAVAGLGFFIYTYLVLKSYYYDLTPALFIRDIDIVLGMEGVVSDLLFYLLFVVISVVLTMFGFMAEIKRRRQAMEHVGLSPHDPDVV